MSREVAPPPIATLSILPVPRMRRERRSRRAGAACAVLAGTLLLSPVAGAGQGTGGGTPAAGEGGGGGGGTLGLSAAAAFGVRLGGARVERDVGGNEVAAELDFGHFAPRRLRLVTGVSFLRSHLLTERVETEGETYRNRFYDLSGHVSVNWLVASPDAPLVPFAGVGVAIHALTSSFHSLAIDSRYNSNNFGLRGSAGVRVRAGGRRALVLELTRAQVRDVSRTTVTVGIDALFNDLARKRQ